MRGLWMLVLAGWAGFATAQQDATPYEDVFQNARAAWVQHETREVDEDRIDADVLYVLGNIANTMFHEFGHALVSDFELPVDGSEEDEVDALANVVMVGETNSPYLDQMIESVADDWFIQGEYEEDEGPSEDGHAASSDRALAVVCILVGSDPEYFREVGDNAGLDADEQSGCQDEYAAAQARWSDALAPHLLADDEAPAVSIPIRYGAAPDGLEAVADITRASGLVEDIVEQMQGSVRFPAPLEVAVESCGEENAFWSPDDRRITLCYEIVQGYLDRALGEDDAS